MTTLIFVKFNQIKTIIKIMAHFLAYIYFSQSVIEKSDLHGKSTLNTLITLSIRCWLDKCKDYYYFF